MKENWEYKRMADVFDLQMGKTPDRDNAEYWNGSETWVAIGDMNDEKYVSSSKEKISALAVEKTKIKLIPENTVMMSFKLSVGKVAIAKKALYSNEAIMAFNVKPGFELIPEYIYYYLKGYKWQSGNRAVMGVTLNKASISQGVFAYPNSNEQKKIVAELDLLSGVIDKQKAQLKELDNLAQSTFYDMFGDPNQNSKNWEMKYLSEVCVSELGKTLNQKTDTGDLKPYLCAINVYWNQINLDILKEAKFEDSTFERYSVRKGDLLVCEGGDIGRCAIWDKDYPILYQNALHRIRFVADVVPIYCLFVLWYLKNHGILDNRYGKGVTIKHLVKSSLYSILIPVPPLSLQQSFADKIASIEKQKAALTQSIAETQKLLDYTMDKYFG